MSQQGLLTGEGGAHINCVWLRVQQHYSLGVSSSAVRTICEDGFTRLCPTVGVVLPCLSCFPSAYIPNVKKKKKSCLPEGTAFIQPLI